MLFDVKSIKPMPLEHSIRVEMDSVGLVYYKAKRIKKLPWLIGIAKDLNTPGCMTIRKTNYGSGMDIAVYSDLTLREVIDSFVNDDGKAVANCAYFDTLKEAADNLRRSLNQI